jgi:hypothetical protein
MSYDENPHLIFVHAAGELADWIRDNPSAHPFEVLNRVTGALMFIDMFARIDELQNIRKATLDADDDVWCTGPSGEIVPLTERLKALLGHYEDFDGHYNFAPSATLNKP